MSGIPSSFQDSSINTLNRKQPVLPRRVVLWQSLWHKRIREVPQTLRPIRRPTVNRSTVSLRTGEESGDSRRQIDRSRQPQAMVRRKRRSAENKRRSPYVGRAHRQGSPDDVQHPTFLLTAISALAILDRYYNIRYLRAHALTAILEGPFCSSDPSWSISLPGIPTHVFHSFLGILSHT